MLWSHNYFIVFADRLSDECWDTDDDMERRITTHSYVSMDCLSIDETMRYTPTEKSSATLTQLSEGATIEIQRASMVSSQSSSKLSEMRTTDQTGWYGVRVQCLGHMLYFIGSKYL